MSAEAIFRVTMALRNRLASALQAAGLANGVFVGPLDDLDANGSALILFLYRVVPNPSLRNREHRVVSSGTPPVEVFRNSLPLDLYYLVTVGTTPGASEEGPLKALGVAMRELQSAPELTGADVAHEPVHVSLEPLTTEEASRIWALFPTANYRTSIAYLATPVWIDPASGSPEAGPVLEDRLRSGSRPAQEASP